MSVTRTEQRVWHDHTGRKLLFGPCPDHDDKYEVVPLHVNIDEMRDLRDALTQALCDMEREPEEPPCTST